MSTYTEIVTSLNTTSNKVLGRNYMKFGTSCEEKKKRNKLELIKGDYNKKTVRFCDKVIIIVISNWLQKPKPYPLIVKSSRSIFEIKKRELNNNYKFILDDFNSSSDDDDDDDDDDNYFN
jgi:hypothetical protein